MTGAGGADAARNVDMSLCTPIEALVRASFPGMTPMLDATAFEADGQTSEGCRVLVVGNADELPSFIDVAGALRTALEGDGWEATDYVADGPAATQMLYTKGDQQALIAAGVSPKDPSACPADQLIGDCLDSLEADEILVQGSVIVAVP